MTTDIQVASATDLSVENSVMNVRSEAFPAGVSLAGATWLTVGVPPSEAMRIVLQFVLGEVRRRASEFSIWLFVGHSAWQPDTRIVRYHKLWGSLRARGTEIPLLGRQQEALLESEAGLKYFGAVQASEFTAESLAQVLLKERCAYLILGPDSMDVTKIIKQGWSGELSEDVSLLMGVSQAEGLTLKILGEFDDKEWGILAIGQPSILSALLD